MQTLIKFDGNHFYDHFDSNFVHNSCVDTNLNDCIIVCAAAAAAAAFIIRIK